MACVRIGLRSTMCVLQEAIYLVDVCAYQRTKKSNHAADLIDPKASTMAAPESDAGARPWADLPVEMVDTMVKHLDLFSTTRLAAVCTS